MLNSILALGSAPGNSSGNNVRNYHTTKSFSNPYAMPLTSSAKYAYKLHPCVLSSIVVGKKQTLGILPIFFLQSHFYVPRHHSNSTASSYH
jgi:hypothetical protein